jgi:hypothetical protein
MAADVNIGQIVADAWDAVDRESRGPGHIIVLETKDRRQFVTHVQWLGKQFEADAVYQAKRGKRTVCKRSLFLLSDRMMRIDQTDCYVFVQRRGRHEPRLTVTPGTWVPIANAPKNLMDLKPKPFDWTRA